MSRIISSPTSSIATTCASPASNDGATTASVGRWSSTCCVLRALEDVPCRLEIADRAATCPTSMPSAARNVFAMPPPMQNASTCCIRLVKTPILSAIFAPPIAQTNGFAGFSVSRESALEFGFHQKAGGARQQMRDALGRRVRAVRRAERVVDVESPSSAS